jgi:hypothetical protein
MMPAPFARRAAFYEAVANLMRLTIAMKVPLTITLTLGSKEPV